MNRADMLERLESRTTAWDMVIIGGGATGLGVAVDAAARGYEVALLERLDFAKGTSSRSTKLVHGGVRYLQQGNVSLVMEALRERGILRRNAPHLVHDLPFIVPNYEWWESPFYGIGLRVYDMLAGKYGFGRSRGLSKDDVVERIPTIETDGLRGGTIYYDGQFDDARLAINLAMTAAEQGAAIANYTPVTGLLKDGAGETRGVRATDSETGREFEIQGKVVINATGPFSDGVRRMDQPAVKPVIAPSQGVHVVLDRAFLSGDAAIMVPHTSDGRVMFAIPWHDCVLVGTTDTPIDSIDAEPTPHKDEIDFILETAGRYLDPPPTRADIRSVYTGIRPLVRAGGGGDSKDTAALSREHSIIISPSGLVTIAGGKWTTYRRMARDTVDRAAELADLKERPCPTESLNIHGYHQHADRFGALRYYGADAPALQSLMDDTPGGAERVHPKLPLTKGEALWAAREEMARTVDDILARRSRCLLFDARAAIEAAPAVAKILGEEFKRDEAWERGQVEAFGEIAGHYVI